MDLTHLNKAVQREVHPMFSVDESLAKLGPVSYTHLTLPTRFAV